MMMRMGAGLAVACSTLLLAGCGTKGVSPSPKVASTTPLENTGRVLLHVKDMCKRLNIV
jgi:hypothetical protein